MKLSRNSIFKHARHARKVGKRMEVIALSKPCENCGGSGPLLTMWNGRGFCGKIECVEAGRNFARQHPQKIHLKDILE